MAYTVATIVGQPANCKTPITITLNVADFASEAALTTIMNNYQDEFGGFARYEDGVLVNSAGTITPDVDNPYITGAIGFVTVRKMGGTNQTISINGLTQIDAWIQNMIDSGKYEYIMFDYRDANGFMQVGTYGTDFAKTNPPINTR